MLVAAKCDNPHTLRDVQPKTISYKARTIIEDLQVYESDLLSPTGPLAAVRGLLAELVANRGKSTGTFRSVGDRYPT